MRYASRRASRAPFVGRIREIAEVRISHGYRRIHVLLRREGWRVNHNGRIGSTAKRGLDCGANGRSGDGAPSHARRASP
jgi:hypothetical protein